jgi:hypothetical protein
MRQEQYDMKFNNEFDQSIASMMARVHEIPPGWRRPFDDAMKALRAVRCPQRASIRMVGPTFCDMQITILHRAMDPVISGIIARLERRTESTCETCGRPGSIRTCGPLRVLCSRCSAPWVLREEITKLMLDLNSRRHDHDHGVVSFDELHPTLRPIIPAEFWRANAASHGRVHAGITTTQLLGSCRQWLETVKQAADREIYRQEAWRELDVGIEVEG